MMDCKTASDAIGYVFHTKSCYLCVMWSSNAKATTY